MHKAMAAPSMNTNVRAVQRGLGSAAALTYMMVDYMPPVPVACSMAGCAFVLRTTRVETNVCVLAVRWVRLLSAKCSALVCACVPELVGLVP